MGLDKFSVGGGRINQTFGSWEESTILSTGVCGIGQNFNRGGWDCLKCPWEQAALVKLSVEAGRWNWSNFLWDSTSGWDWSQGDWSDFQ